LELGQQLVYPLLEVAFYVPVVIALTCGGWSSGLEEGRVDSSATSVCGVRTPFHDLLCA
jgi:hypothetical protein